MPTCVAKAEPKSAPRSVPWVGVLLIASVGCGPATPLEDATPVSNRDALQGDNGLAENGLAENGLAENGLAENGLSGNGGFPAWFAANPAQRAQLMRYLVACAVPAGEVRTFINPTTGTPYSWEGKLGLAPGWASGHPATVTEQQAVSACLAAHVNPYGAHVSFSLLGLDGRSNPIAYTPAELAEFSVREACFFGNLFTNGGLYAGNDRNMLGATQSSLRGCGLSGALSGSSPVCPSMVRVGLCDTSNCTLDSRGLYYTQCTHNGVRYRPLTTRIRPSTLYTCGDGICQLTEHCGTGWTPESCQADCGLCP